MPKVSFIISYVTLAFSNRRNIVFHCEPSWVINKKTQHGPTKRHIKDPKSMHILKENESLTDINGLSLNDLQMDYSTTCIIVKLLIFKAFSMTTTSMP